jgi:hypothetical protein
MGLRRAEAGETRFSKYVQGLVSVMIRNQLKSSRINAVHLFKHKPCLTAVGQARA